MNIIKPGYTILTPDLDDPKTAYETYWKIEYAGRTCYKSEDKITEDSAAKFVRNIRKNQHGAMLEHASMTVRFTVDRGVSHELVRHRLASFAQESTRYCNYMSEKFGGGITFIKPFFLKEGTFEYEIWKTSMQNAENAYFTLIKKGCTPQEARTVLPNSLKTEVVMTANMREWRHFFDLRAAGLTGKPHPQMLEVAVPLANECALKLPALFEDYLDILPKLEEEEQK